MKLVDVGRVIRVVDFVSKKGDIVYILLVEGVNAAWKVFSRRSYAVDDRVLVFEKNGRIFVTSLDEWK